MEVKLDVDAIINHFGGITPLYEKLSAAGFKITRKAVEKWKERASIPTNGWLQIEMLAESQGSLNELKDIAVIKSDISASPQDREQVTKKLTKSQISKLYKDMLYFRRFEEKAGQLYGMGKIAGFCHLYIGQEAVAAGMQFCLEDGDSVITSYRDHALMLACGSEPTSVMGELMGKELGCSKGKGGSMHMFDLDNHFYGGHGIVGASVPLGTGIAFGNKYKSNGKICLTYFGDGAANQGQVYESFNMASLWNLPVLYIIENNEYAMGTSVQRSSSTTELFRRGDSFAIAGKQVDGMDVMSVIAEGQKAVDYVRSGKGPMILEMKTYRYRGHSMSDPAKYRSREEVEDVKEKRDPIESLKKFILDNKYSDAESLKKLDKQLKAEIAEIVEKCENSSEPDESELWTDIYA